LTSFIGTSANIMRSNYGVDRWVQPASLVGEAGARRARNKNNDYRSRRTRTPVDAECAVDGAFAKKGLRDPGGLAPIKVADRNSARMETPMSGFDKQQDFKVTAPATYFPTETSTT
jgi:hypothetical protein